MKVNVLTAESLTVSLQRPVELLTVDLLAAPVVVVVVVGGVVVLVVTGVVVVVVVVGVAVVPVGVARGAVVVDAALGTGALFAPALRSLTTVVFVEPRGEWALGATGLPAVPSTTPAATAARRTPAEAASTRGCLHQLRGCAIPLPAPGPPSSRPAPAAEGAAAPGRSRTRPWSATPLSRADGSGSCGVSLIGLPLRVCAEGWRGRAPLICAAVPLHVRSQHWPRRNSMHCLGRAIQGTRLERPSTQTRVEPPGSRRLGA